jgi:hypothetical protein
LQAEGDVLVLRAGDVTLPIGHRPASRGS